MQARPKSEKAEAQWKCARHGRSRQILIASSKREGGLCWWSLCRVTTPDGTQTGGRTSPDDLRFVHCHLGEGRCQTRRRPPRATAGFSWALVHSHTPCRVLSRLKTYKSAMKYRQKRRGDVEVEVEVDAVPLNVSLSTLYRADGTSLTAVEAVVPIGERSGWCMRASGRHQGLLIRLRRVRGATEWPPVP